MENIIFKAFLSSNELTEVQRIIEKQGRYTEAELDFMLSLASRTTRIPLNPTPAGIETHIRRDEGGIFSIVDSNANGHLNN